MLIAEAFRSPSSPTSQFISKLATGNVLLHVYDTLEHPRLNFSHDAQLSRLLYATVHQIGVYEGIISLTLLCIVVADVSLYQTSPIDHKQNARVVVFTTMPPFPLSVFSPLPCARISILFHCCTDLGATALLHSFLVSLLSRCRVSLVLRITSALRQGSGVTLPGLAILLTSQTSKDPTPIYISLTLAPQLLDLRIAASHHRDPVVMKYEHNDLAQSDDEILVAVLESGSYRDPIGVRLVRRELKI